MALMLFTFVEGFKTHTLCRLKHWHKIINSCKYSGQDMFEPYKMEVFDRRVKYSKETDG